MATQDEVFDTLLEQIILKVKSGNLTSAAIRDLAEAWALLVHPATKGTNVSVTGK